MGAWFAYLLASSLAPHEAQTGARAATTRGYSLPWRCRVAVLSQSEDQSRPHPVPGFVRPMSTQVRSLSLDMHEGAYLPDPQIATRMRIRGGKRVGKYPRCRINQAYAGRHGGHPTPLPFSRRISTVLTSNKYRSHEQ